LEKRLGQLRSDVRHVDATLRIINPTFKLDGIVPKVRRPRCNGFGKGELMRLILETLRKVQKPLTSREITLAVMGPQGIRPERSGDVPAGRETRGCRAAAQGGAGRASGLRATGGGVAGARGGVVDKVQHGWPRDILGNLRQQPLSTS
jgi:hypothetical protein